MIAMRLVAMHDTPKRRRGRPAHTERQADIDRCIGCAIARLVMDRPVAEVQLQFGYRSIRSVYNAIERAKALDHPAAGIFRAIDASRDRPHRSAS